MADPKSYPGNLHDKDQRLGPLSLLSFLLLLSGLLEGHLLQEAWGSPRHSGSYQALIPSRVCGNACSSLHPITLGFSLTLPPFKGLCH